MKYENLMVWLAIENGGQKVVFGVFGGGVLWEPISAEPQIKNLSGLWRLCSHHFGYGYGSDSDGTLNNTALPVASVLELQQIIVQRQQVTVIWLTSELGWVTSDSDIDVGFGTIY